MVEALALWQLGSPQRHMTMRGAQRYLDLLSKIGADSSGVHFEMLLDDTKPLGFQNKYFLELIFIKDPTYLNV